MAKSHKELLKSKNQLSKPTKGYDLDSYYGNRLPDKLDVIEEQIEQLSGIVEKSQYYIGERLEEIRKNHLDKKYKNIAEYAEEKFGFKKTATYNYIFVYKNFDPVHSGELGTKLWLLRGLDKTIQLDLIDWMLTKNPSKAEVEKKVQSIKNTIPENNNDKEKLFNDTFNYITNKKFNIPEDKKNEFKKKLLELIQQFVE